MCKLYYAITRIAKLIKKTFMKTVSFETTFILVMNIVIMIMIIAVFTLQTDNPSGSVKTANINDNNNF